MPKNTPPNRPHSRYIPGRTRHTLPSTDPEPESPTPIPDSTALDPTDPLETPIVDAGLNPNSTGDEENGGEDGENEGGNGESEEWDEEDEELHAELYGQPSGLLDSPPDSPLDKPYTPEESPLRAEREEHVRATAPRAGRPRNDGMPRGSVHPDQKIPTPGRRVFKSDATSANTRPKAFFNWWNALPQWAKERTILYVYRDWPILRPVPEDAQGEYAYIDKIDGQNPVQDEMDLLHRYGAGSYKLLFNQQPGGNLVTIYCTNLGMGDMRSNPPADRRVSDIRQVDVDNPGNKSYMEFLRIIGRHPDQIKGDTEDDMANTMVVDKAFQVLERAAERGAIAAEHSGRSDSEVVAVMADASRKSTELMYEGMQKVLNKLSESNQTQTPAAGMDMAAVMDMVTKVVELSRAMQPETPRVVTGGAEEMTPLLSDIRQLNDRILDMERAHAAKIAEMQRENFQIQLDTLREELRERRENPAEEVVAEAAGDMAPKWLRPYMPVVAPVLQALAMKLLMPGQTPIPMPPGMPPGVQPGMPGMPGMGAAPMPPNALPPAPNPAILPTPLPNANPAASNSADPMAEQINQVISMIAPGLLASINNNESGLDFADSFIGFYKDQMYEEIIRFGEPVILAALYGHERLGPQLRMFPEERVRLFVHQFVNYDALTEEPAAAGTGVVTPTPTTPTTPTTPVTGGGTPAA